MFAGATAQLQLERIAATFRQAQDRVHGLARSVPADRWNVRRHPESWSVAECVAHLNLASRAFIPLLRKAFDHPLVARLKAPPFYRRDVMGWVLSVLVGPAPRIRGRRIGRLRTAPSFVPRGDLDMAGIVSEFDTLQAELLALVREAEGRSLEHMHIVSPFDSRVRYNAYSALVIVSRHQLRHLVQAEDVWSGGAGGYSS